MTDSIDIDRSLRRVHVALAERSYDILIGAGLLAKAESSLRALGRCTHAIIIADEAVVQYANQILSACSSWHPSSILRVPSGESSKSVEQADRLWQELLGAGADRKTTIIAVGGGVVGDLAGFIAATFARALVLPDSNHASFPSGQ